MIKIRRLKFSDIKKIREMIEYVVPGAAYAYISEKYFTYFPFNLLHNLLPVSYKFLQECYVAVKDDKLLSLVCIAPDGKKKTRWKISRFIVSTDGYEVGRKLVNYVINKYGGAGVESFITIIDENYSEAITLFKNACSFRSCSKIQIWEKENPESQETKNIELLRKAKYLDNKKVYELEQQSLFPQFKMSLSKSLADFDFSLKSKIINNLKYPKIDKFVLENPARNSIEGYISITTNDNKNFWADIILSLPYQQYYDDLINFVIKDIRSKAENPKLYIYDRKYYQSSKELSETLNKLEFKPVQNFQILIKDYWKVIPTAIKKKSPIIILSDITSPACNITPLN